MRATSTEQLAAMRSGRIPEIEEVRPGLFAIPLDMPGLQPPYAYSYAALAADGSGAVDLVDAGLGTEENWEALGVALAGIGSGIERVASVTLTHLHRDHVGLADRVREASGATVRMHAREAAAVRGTARYGTAPDRERALAAWGVPAERLAELAAIAGAPADAGSAVAVDEELADGDAIQLGRYRGIAIHTPGHTAGHLCVAIPAEQLVFTGDHVLPVINPGIALGGERAADPLGEYYASLDRVAALGDAEALPGHGFRFAGVAARCAEIRAHHERRTAQVAAAVADDPGLTVWETASRVEWSDGWDGLAGVSLLSALAQTEMHLARVGSERDPAQPSGQ